MTARILIVDDDPAVRVSLSDAVRDFGLQAEAAASADAAFKLIADSSPDIVVTDVRMPGTDGLEFLVILRDRSPSIDVVLMTAFDDMETVVRGMRDGAADFIVKPLDLEELRTTLESLVANRRRRRKDPDLGRQPEEDPSVAPSWGLVGRDPRMIEVFKKIGRVASKRITVLVRGETGTGKERVARAIHAHSGLEAPFVAVNCAAVPTSLLESELFGHVRGAFTGAVEDRKGRFAQAEGGTLFLDEIGDTTHEFQAKLLRVLEDGEYTPVGSDIPARADVRIITATRRNLESMVAGGDFRDDLYFRLRVAEIRLPPLRDRPNDIPELARHLLQRVASSMEREVPALPPETVERLMARSWLGNVRELENCLARALATTSGSVLRPDDLDFGSESTEARAEVTVELRTLEEVNREHVAEVMSAVGGNKTRAAEVLGISRPTLYRLLEGVQRE